MQIKPMPASARDVLRNYPELSRACAGAIEPCQCPIRAVALSTTTLADKEEIAMSVLSLPRGWIEVLGDRWRRWRETVVNRIDIDKFSAAELARLARDIGLDSAEFKKLAARDSHSADLLLRHMAALRLEFAAIKAKYPEVIRDLQRCCTICDNKAQCERSLEGNQSLGEALDYCPNKDTLSVLKSDKCH
jgi:hypothetical protein